MRRLPITTASFTRRLDRSRFIACHLSRYLDGRVLDVGCDEGHLRQLLPNVAYTGIDIGGSPDLVVNLEEIDRLPFEDGRFQAVVCSDVLEHLDNLHHVFAEMVRVTGRYLIISLPNNWTNARRPIERGKGSFSFYGLPSVKPRDRHKWFFSLSEARDFFEAQTTLHSLRIVECFATEKKRNPLVSIARRLRFASQMRYLNRYAHTLWVVFEKMPAQPGHE